MDPQPPVPHDLRPLSAADLKPPQDPHNFYPPDRIVDPPERSLELAFKRHYEPVYSVVRTPPDLSPHLHHLHGEPLHLIQPHTPYINDDAPAVEAAIIRAGIAARGYQMPLTWEGLANRPSPIIEPSVPPPAGSREVSYTCGVTEPQEPIQHIYLPPPEEVGMSGSTVSGLPLPPLRSPPGVSEVATPQRTWSYVHTSSSSSALGFQPAPPSSLGNGNNPNSTPLLPMQPQYARLSEREVAALEREAVALRVSQSHDHAGQSDQTQQRNAWANNQTPAQVGQLPQHPCQPSPPTGHLLALINTPNTALTPLVHMDSTMTSLRPAVFSSPSPESDLTSNNAPPSTTASNLISRDSSSQVLGDSVSNEVPIAIDPTAGCKRTAEEAFAGDEALDLGGRECVDCGEGEGEMIDELMEESKTGVAAEAAAMDNNVPVFIHEDGRRPQPKKRKLNDATNTRGIGIRLPPPPSLAGTSRPPAAPTPVVVLNQLDADSPAPHPPPLAPAAPTDTTPATANLPPPVPMFQRDPDAPPSYADWVRQNRPDAEIERWMECTRRNLVYDPSAVPAPPEGFESGKDRRKESDNGEGTSGEKDDDGQGEGEGGDEGEGEGSAEKEKGKEKEGNTERSPGGSGTSKPYEIDENTPPNINEGLWCLFDYPRTTKPKYSYAFMARVAILGSPTRRLQLQDIYIMIEAKFPFYRDGNHVSWKNSIRHNLSTNKWFVKCERDMVHEPGYSAMWTVDTTSKGGPKKKRERLGRSKKGRAVLAAREAAGKGIIPDPRIVALAIAMKTAPPIVPAGVPIIGSAVPPPKLPPTNPNKAEKPPSKKKTATPVPIVPASAPAASLPPITPPTPPSSSAPIPSPTGPLGGVERDTPMEIDSAEPGGERNSPLFPTASVPPIVTAAANTNTPTEPLTTIKFEAVDSGIPKKTRWKTRAPPKTLELPLTSTPLASASTPIRRRSTTPPKVPTPPFMARRLSPAAPPTPHAPPQSQSQRSKTPPVFPHLNVFTQTKGPQPAPLELQPPLRAMPSPQDQPPPAARPNSPPIAQLTMPAQPSTPRPISVPSAAEEKNKVGRKGFDPHLFQRLVEKENPEKRGGEKPAVNRLFAVPATRAAPSVSTPTPLKPPTPFGSTGVGAGFASFGLAKAPSFGASGFGTSATAVAQPTHAPGNGGFGGFGSKAGSGFAAFGTAATGSSTPESKFGFTPAVFSNRASTSSIKTSNVRGEDHHDNEENRGSDTDDLGVDMNVDVEEDLSIRTRHHTMGELKASTAPQPQTQTQMTQESGPADPQSSVTTPAPVPQYSQVNTSLNDALLAQSAPSGPSHSVPTATVAPTQTMVTPISSPASPIQGLMTNSLRATSLFYLDAKPRRRDLPSGSSSGASSPSGPTTLIKQTIRKYVTLDPMTLVPAVVDLDQMLSDLHTMRLVVHHNFLPRAPPLNGDYRRGLENLLKKERKKRGEPGMVYRGAADGDLGSATESDDSGIEIEFL